MLLMIGGACAAAPTYLECKQSKPDAETYYVTIDESNKSVTYSYMAGMNGDEEVSFHLPGSFKANTVSFVQPSVHGSTQMVINRNDLSYIMTFKFSLDNSRELKGKCEIIKSKGRRKF